MLTQKRKYSHYLLADGWISCGVIKVSESPEIPNRCEKTLFTVAANLKEFALKWVHKLEHALVA